jgi:pimeloyl-ACP methyl ester carboxylesterase
MFEKIKANILFDKLLKRPDINTAYAMVPETDSWYDTIKKVHESLDEIIQKPCEILEIKSKDGLCLKGIYYPNENKSDVTVICVHGYTSHAEREWAFPGLFYLSIGCNVLIPYQRAHGLSEGKYISFGALEYLDMVGWVEKINEMHPNGKIIIHGLSMGGGIVLDLSKIEMKNVKCLIADAPSISIESFFKNVSRSVFKTNSEKIASYAIERFKKEFGCDVKDFDGINIVSDCKYPLLLSAGSNENLDEIFEKLKSANPNETETILLPGCNHGNGMYKQTELYQSKIVQFLEKYL